MKKDNEINKVKELYNKYKEAKKDPRKKAGMKLLGYLIFFLLIALFANISNDISKTNENFKPTTTTTTKVVDSYVEKQNNLFTNKNNINYEITYNDKKDIIKGTLENNIINGYLENENIIKKIIIKNNSIYEINNNEETELEVEFNVNNLNLFNIINSIKQTSAFIKEKEDIKTYLYELDNKKIYVESNKEQIFNIKIEEENEVYSLSFDN